MKRSRVLIFLAVTLAAVFLLAAGLSGLELRAGQPFPWNWNPLFPRGDQFGILPGGEFIMKLMRALYFLGLILLPLFILLLIISPQARKQFLIELMRVLPFILIFLLLAYGLQRLSGRVAETPFSELPAPPNELPYPAPSLTLDSEPPRWLVWVLSLGLAALLAGLTGGIVWYVWRRAHRPESPIRRLGLQAERALDELKEGGDLKNIVIRCYFEMSRVLSEQRGIRRERAMTPREFERRLDENGLPSGPVRQLTQLFEEVRYGARIPDESEERKAIESLTSIVQFCTAVKSQQARMTSPSRKDAHR